MQTSERKEANGAFQLTPKHAQKESITPSLNFWLLLVVWETQMWTTKVLGTCLEAEIWPLKTGCRAKPCCAWGLLGGDS